MERFLKLREAAELLGLSPRTLRRWLREGNGPAFKRTPRDGVYLFRKSDLLEWAAGLDGPAQIEIPKAPNAV